MNPVTTTPLKKAIRTLEGWVAAIATAVPWVVAIIDPNTLPPKIAAEWSAITAVALVVSRTALKAVAAAKGATGIDPAPIDLAALAAQVAAKIDITNLPTTSEVQAIVAEAIKLAQHPSELLTGLPTDAVEAANPPSVE